MIRVATLNLKQAVAPKRSPEALWEWLGENVDPTVAVLTEAKLPNGPLPSGWTALHTEGGFGPRRRWGTVLTARGATLRPLNSVRQGLRTHTLALTWPAGVQVADVLVGDERWATLVGVYGITVDRHGKSCGSGHYSIPHIMRELRPLLTSRTGERLILAGDFNLWPVDTRKAMRDSGLVDVVERTAHTRPPLEGCSGCGMGDACGHLWTHRNGTSPNSARQHIDYIFASEAVALELTSVYGGPSDFPDTWEISDHSPVVAEFS